MECPRFMVCNRNSKDEINRKGLGSSSKSSTNPYNDLRSTRSRELQRHSHSPSDGMILTASGLTLDTSNDDYGIEVSRLFCRNDSIILNIKRSTYYRCNLDKYCDELFHYINHIIFLEYEEGK